jgi:hypothetical protein
MIETARAAGIPWEHLLYGAPFALGFYRSPLAKLAQKAGEVGARGAGKTIKTVAEPSSIGAGVGQLSGEADDSGGRDVYVHARPQ